MSKRAPNPLLPAAIDAAPEFRNGHVDTPPSEEAFTLSRRGLLGAMTATFALVGAEGCRRPLEKIVPYTKMPEDVIPGVPSHFATVFPRRGDALGLVVESHEGRPTKIEGNEAHPGSLGAADVVGQASILELYDPDCSTAPRKAGASTTWNDFDLALFTKLADYDKDQGARLRVLLPPTISPTVLRMRAAVMQRFPKAKFHTWSAAGDSNVRAGAKIAFGQPVNTIYALDKAHVILSLDSDFLGTETGNVRWTKAFAAGRKLRSSHDAMSRLYVVEPARTTTGNSADHRLRLAASDVAGYAFALAAELSKSGLAIEGASNAAKAAGPVKVPAKWLATVAKDLLQARGRVAILVGSRQPPEVHALVHAIHAALNATNSIVSYAPVADADEQDAVTDLKSLTDAMGAGQVDGLFVFGSNPVYDAPADLGFAEKLAKVPFSVQAGLFFDETGEKCAWHVNTAHEYESWGDAQALDGTVAIQQPLIAPLYAGRSTIEMLAQLAGGSAPEKTGHDAVRATAKTQLEAGGQTGLVAERAWNAALASGLLHKTHTPAAAMIASGAIGAAIDARKAPPAAGPFEVTFAPCPKLVDGRFANNTWLLELPDSVTKLSWDNAAIVSPASAEELGVKNGDFVKVTAGDRAIDVPVWIVPGQADHSIALTLGWGRKNAGRVGSGKGFDVYPLRTSGTLGFTTANVAKTGAEPYFFAQTQEENTTHDRPIAHVATLEEYRKKPNFPDLDAPPQRTLPLWEQQDYSKGHQWGMAIDLNACTGCNACFVACMSENNVPVVGKREVWRGREMHWLRVDRYYFDNAAIGGSEDEPVTLYQPLMCVHCEEAPCENVCPVNATIHGPEGLNEMAYNRCIGTRYCANNCPYKVRRFNYLNWHNDSVFKETGGLPETLAMQQNPNVTVRFRGVMEKCTYCVQRIQSSKIRAKRELRDLRDGEIKTACQQTCPADAIVFGDLNDPNSNVTRATRIDRRFGLLAELGTRPRTTYLGKVRNPNPEMA